MVGDGRRKKSRMDLVHTNISVDQLLALHFTPVFHSILLHFTLILLHSTLLHSYTLYILTLLHSTPLLKILKIIKIKKS